MFDLKSIRPTKRDMPPRILIYGQHKIGKSTFASQAESPVFIPTEDGQDAIDAKSFPLAKKWDDILSAITTLYQEPHEFKTVVLDSADWAETLAQKKAVENQENAKIKSIEDIGYGKGYVYAADVFRDLLDGLNALRIDKKMNVIIICHSEIKRFDDPLSESYDRYQIKLHKLIAKMVQEWADIIGFAQLATGTKKEDQGFGQERTRAIDLGRRILSLVGTPAFEAGNRFGLPNQINLNWAELDEAMKKNRA